MSTDSSSGQNLHRKEKDMDKIKIVQQSSMVFVWCAAWLFTIGFLHLSFWPGVLAIMIWPYYLGMHFSPLAH